MNLGSKLKENSKPKEDRAYELVVSTFKYGIAKGMESPMFMHYITGDPMRDVTFDPPVKAKLQAWAMKEDLILEFDRKNPDYWSIILTYVN